MIKKLSLFRSRLLGHRTLIYNLKDSTNSLSSDSSANGPVFDLKEFARFSEIKEYKDVNIDQFTELIETDEDRQKIEAALEEYEIIKYESGFVPTTITLEHMKVILEEEEPLHKYFHFLAITEARKYHTKQRNLIKPKKQAEDDFECGVSFDPVTKAPKYGLWHNSMLMRLNEIQLGAAIIPKLLSSSFFGQKLVIDCDYDECMKRRESKSAVKQITFGWNHIKKMSDPFDLWFCNFRQETRFAEYFKAAFGEHQEHLYKWTFMKRRESYLDLFPNEKLVYLSPDGKTPLYEFDHDAIYIIGGFADVSGHKPLSLAKCKKEKIRCVKFPLDDFLFFKGAKVLTIDQVMGILVGLKSGNGFKEVFEQFVPRRKLKTDEEVQAEQAQRLNKLKKAKKIERNFNLESFNKTSTNKLNSP